MLNLNLNWVSETIKTLAQWWPVVKSNFQSIQDNFNNHVSGTADKHAAEHVTYSGNATGSTVKEALDNTDTRIDNLVITGTTHDPFVTDSLIDAEGENFGPAPGNETYLNGRLTKWENKIISHLADYAKYVAQPVCNVKGFGAVGDGVTDDTQAFLSAMQYCEVNKVNLFIPPGNYLITGELPFPNDYIIEGEGYNSNLILNLSAGQFCFKDLINWRYHFGICNLHFSIVNGASKNVGAIAVESVLRGGVIQNIWCDELHQPLYLGDQIWGVVSVSNLFAYLITGQREADVIAFHAKGNTVMMDNIEIIGDFYTCMKLDTVNVFKLHGFNIGGSDTTYQAVNAIEIVGSSHGSIKSGWIEQLDDGVWANGRGHAIYCQDSPDISVDNVNIASGSIFSDASVVKADNVEFGQVNGGFQILNDGKIYTLTKDFSKQFSDCADGQVIFLDQAVVPKGILPNPVLKTGVSYGFLTSTNASYVTLTSETTDYLTGDRAIKASVTSDFHGVKITRSGLKANKLYTVVALVKPVSGILSTHGIQLVNGTNTSINLTQPTTIKRSNNTNYHLLILPCSTSTGTLEAKIITRLAGVDPAVFLVDSVDIFEGYNPFDLQNYTTDFLRNNNIYKDTAAPTVGTWSQGDIVYNISPAAGGYIGWICVTGGAPGTWKGFGAISA